MKIKRIDEVFDIYDTHFPNRIGMDPKLEFMLVQALLIVMACLLESAESTFCVFGTV